MGPLHHNPAYAADLDRLRERLLYMGGQAEAMIDEAVRAFITRDGALAQRARSRDDAIDLAEIELDAMCVRVLAQRQPLAGDLRFVARALKMSTDLERIGDLAKNMADRVELLDRGPALTAEADFPSLARAVQSMVSNAINAFVRADVPLALSVTDCDDAVDELYHRIWRAAAASMRVDAARIEHALHVQLAAKFLERMADHATNIAEQVVYVVEGREIRHRRAREAASSG